MAKLNIFQRSPLTTNYQHVNLRPPKSSKMEGYMICDYGGSFRVNCRHQTSAAAHSAVTLLTLLRSFITLNISAVAALTARVRVYPRGTRSSRTTHTRRSGAWLTRPGTTLSPAPPAPRPSYQTPRPPPRRSRSPRRGQNKVKMSRVR